MFLAQPARTARLKALEEEVGDELFVRTSRGMRLTDAGKEFAPYGERGAGSFDEGRRPPAGAGWARGRPRGWRRTRAGGDCAPCAGGVLGSAEGGRRRLQGLRGATGGRLLIGA